MKGYKYRDFKHFERDLESLKKNQIYAPPFVELNDPFEGACNEEITELAKLLEDLFKVDSSEVVKSLEEIKSFKTKLGIYSMSKNYSEVLLWSHYASSHTGFCIEYDVSKLKEKNLATLTVNELIVDYQPHPATLTYKDIGSNSLLQKLYATKSLKWKYEEEIRLVFDTSSFKDYHPSALTGIYFGLNFTSAQKQKLINSLDNRDVKFYEVYRDNNSYELKRKLVHQNTRIILKKINYNDFELLKTNHTLQIENFDVLYKGEKKDDESINYFFESFKENFTTKDSNISLFDDKSVYPLLNKCPLSDDEYIRLADHFIAMSSYYMPGFTWYPYQDSQYEERGGRNWKEENQKSKTSPQ